MNIKIDKNNPIPIGVQIREQLKILIHTGELIDGHKLPSINELASLLSVNKNTIVTTLKELENQGYVESFRGRGVFVRQSNKEKAVNIEFMQRVDLFIGEAKKRNIGVNELIHLISARYENASEIKRKNLLFLTGISQELVDVNVHKLKQHIPSADIEGMYLTKNLTRESASRSFRWADVLIVPVSIYERIKERLPYDKPVITTMANLKSVEGLRRGIEKKSKVAIIGNTQSGAQILANLFIDAKILRPKLVLSLQDLDEYKKELKEIHTVVVCLSARAAIEKLKLRDKNIYFFSDYIAEESILEIKQYLKKT